MSNNVAFTDNKILKVQGADKTMMLLSANTVKPVKVLYPHAGRLGTDDGEIRYVSVRNVKKLLKDMRSFKDVEGFVVPVPEMSAPIWNDKLERGLGQYCDNVLYELFDQDIEKSSVRSWYYETLTRYIINTYLRPLIRFFKSIDKEVIFDLGRAGMQYDLMKKMICPDLIRKSGISVAVHKESGNIEKELGLGNCGFVISGDEIARVEGSDNAKILLIKPTRGIMERYCQGEIRNKANRLETPALLAGIESVYYCDRLLEKGYSFDVVDENRMPKISDLVKYENILICNSCLFTEKETKKIDKLHKIGVKINDRDLICDIMEKGEY